MIEQVKQYYERKIGEHGATPMGVDWNGEQSQKIRFAALSRLLLRATDEPMSIDDYGCGYGAYVDYLVESGVSEVDYLGLDVAPKMIEAARTRHPKQNFVVGHFSPRIADYAIASGIFNVALQADRATWKNYILNTLDEIHARTIAGFAFNCLTSHSDRDKMRPHLYYGDPCFFFDHCKRSYSNQVALLHDYGLYEFTILVRKKV
jgi:SAM-dependent methyltransferase